MFAFYTMSNIILNFCLCADVTVMIGMQDFYRIYSVSLPMPIQLWFALCLVFALPLLIQALIERNSKILLATKSGEVTTIY